MKMLNEESKESSTRAAMMLCVLGALVVAGVGVWLDRDLIGLTALVTPFLGFGIGGKVAQKGKEVQK